MITPISDSPDNDLTLLVKRRAELLARLAEGSLVGDEHVELADLSTRLRTQLGAQPNRIRQLGAIQDHQLLMRLASLEPVHPLDDPGNPEEIIRRVEGDRMAFVLENPALGDLPLNVVWVALCSGLPATIGELLRPDREPINPSRASTAVFYSIWGIEDGLKGVPGGSELLKLAMAKLRSEFPDLSVYTTLSPIPGFRSWVTQVSHPVLANTGDTSGLLEACAQYLCSVDDNSKLIDSVARFHMRNGASMWRLLADADASQQGQRNSWGIMVNYRYSPEDLEANAQRFSAGHLVMSESVRVLLDQRS